MAGYGLPVRGGELVLSTFTHGTFAKGESLKVSFGDRQVVEMVVASVNLGRNKLPSAARESFSLVFKGPKDFHLPQGIYRADHSKVGTFEIFLVPIVSPGGDREASYYESVFS